jgi:hypothetical protein
VSFVIEPAGSLLIISILFSFPKKWEVIPLAHAISTQALYIFAVDGEVEYFYLL